MPTRSRKITAAVLASVITLAPLASIAAEFVSSGKPSGEVVSPVANLQTTCWQNGSKIFERANLSGIDVGSAIREETLALKKAGQPGSDTIIVPLGRTTCIVSSPN